MKILENLQEGGFHSGGITKTPVRAFGELPEGICEEIPEGTMRGISIETAGNINSSNEYLSVKRKINQVS